MFPGITNGVNTIGRYYAKTHLYFTEFYNTIKDEILFGYNFIEKIISNLKINYKNYNLNDLQCFMKTISEI